MNPDEALRSAESVSVSLDVVWHGSAGKFDGRMGEISMEGCFIGSLGQETLGEVIGFTVRLPSGIWVALCGQVTYVEPPIGFEVKFKNLSEENERLLMDVVAANGGLHAQQSIREETIRGAEVRAAVSPRILIADDDPVTIEMLKAAIQVQGYETVCVKDGREAYNLLRTDADFTAIILDMNMPHFSGLSLVQYVKSDERLRGIPIGMVTAEEDPKVWNDSAAAGVNMFLPKPFTPPQIHMMLRMLDKDGVALSLQNAKMEAAVTI